MYIENPILCDECKAAHEGKGWFTVVISPESIIVQDFSLDLAKQNIPALCGQNCLHKYTAPYLERLHRRADEKEKMDPAPVV